MTGSSSRSGATSALPSPSGPTKTASTITKLLPRIGSGTSGKGGKRRIRPTDVTSYGTVSAQSRQQRNTSPARSTGQNIAPAYSSGVGYSSISIAVTTPKLPPPPRTAQNRSGWFSLSSRTNVPSEVTSST